MVGALEAVADRYLELLGGKREDDDDQGLAHGSCRTRYRPTIGKSGRGTLWACPTSR